MKKWRIAYGVRCSRLAARTAALRGASPFEGEADETWRMNFADRSLARRSFFPGVR
jgi:hypothetical protein